MRRSKRQSKGSELSFASESPLNRLRTKVRRITQILERNYGIPRRKKHSDPVEVLIQTILSQNTSDQNRDRAYQRLIFRFPRWEDVLAAKTGALFQAIRPGGLARQKARRIREFLYWLEEREGNLGLSFLRKMDSEEIKKILGGLKGIGPKTLHCLLLFGLGREAFPVDTHILRIGQRLGFIPERMHAEEAHEWAASLIPENKSLSLHLNLIRFGRKTCKARQPQCDLCFLSRECVHPGRQSGPIRRTSGQGRGSSKDHPFHAPD